MLEKQYKKSLEKRYKNYNDAIEYIGELESIISGLLKTKDNINRYGYWKWKWLSKRRAI